MMNRNLLQFSICMLFVSPLFSNSLQMNQTQDKLQNLKKQIVVLERGIHNAQDQKGLLTQQLAATEKKISQGVFAIHKLEHTMELVNSKILNLQQKNFQLASQLAEQKQILAAHIRAQYISDPHEVLKYLLSPEKYNKKSRILNYYSYIIRARKKSIDSIYNLSILLKQNETSLNNELTTKKALAQKLATNQNKLGMSRISNHDLIIALEAQIKKSLHDLNDAEKSKNDLTQLLDTLAKQNINRKPLESSLTSMQKKLPFPISQKNSSTKLMNQGVTFFAEEGTPVTAVSAGVVVFSDWLKGYGLLLIIDHGQGLMSLYAHNESLFKNKGDSVTVNEQIASVGHSGGLKENGLYFEIRLKGKAMPPLTFLA